jgi:hypothetical protein
MNRTVAFAVFLASAFSFLFAANAAEVATPNDTARFLAGLPPSAESPLAAFTQSPGWRQHASAFGASFDNVDKSQLSKVRAWSQANVTTTRSVLFYMFGGPDFLYANSFYPNASTYVLSGLEAVGEQPDVLKLNPAAMTSALEGLRGSLRSVLATSYFITSYMGHDLYRSRLTGTLPVLYVFLARTGHTIQDVSLISLDESGSVSSSDPSAPRDKRVTRGVKITFSGSDGAPRTLYYFSVDLANNRFKNSAFSLFCEKLDKGDSLVKSASYLLHGSNFSQVRQFLLDHSSTIVQDDTGIPIGIYDPSKWQLHPFGNYVRPIPVFAHMYQPKMQALFKGGNPSPIDFKLGYRWRPSQSSLILAQRKDSSASQ